MRGFGAISAAIKSSKLLSEQEVAHGGSVEESNPGSPEAVETAAISPVAAVESAPKTTSLAAVSNLMGADEETAAAHAAAAAVAGGNGNGDAETQPPPFDGKHSTSSFRFDSSCLNSIQPGMLVGNPEAETLNIPAVLWDRPVGSSKRVPPPVPPRSPRRPYDHSISFAAASDSAAFRGDLKASSASRKSSVVSLPAKIDS